MSKPVIFLLNKITERGRIDELLFPVGFLTFLVFTLLFNATYINLIEDINRAPPFQQDFPGKRLSVQGLRRFLSPCQAFPGESELTKALPLVFRPGDCQHPRIRCHP